MDIEPPSITVTVPFDVGRCSPNRRLHWAVRAREVKAARLAARVAWRVAGEPRMTGPVDVSLFIRRGRVVDQDNALASCKALLDGLFNGGITPSDSCEWVRYVDVRQETGTKWRQAPEVVVTVRPRAPA